jgi:hypothetical protein
LAPSPKKLQWLAINRDATGVFSAASNATIKRERYLSAKTSKSSLPYTAIRSRAHLHHRCARAVLAEDVIADTDLI